MSHGELADTAFHVLDGHTEGPDSPAEWFEATTAVEISVLMTTYGREKADNLEKSLESLYAQTRVPDELVLVLDGPVGKDQWDVIERYRQDSRKPALVLVELPRNVGLADALNVGLGECTGKFIMRMDSDDICAPDRTELQLDYMRTHPEIDIVTSWCEDFVDESRPGRIKSSPVSHDAIVSALRWRDVLVHPTMFIVADTLRKVGGYRGKFGKNEDYDLWVRLALSGARFHVLPKALLRVRTGLEVAHRRGGLRYCWLEIKMRYEFWRKGFLSLSQFLVVGALYASFRLIPGRLRQALYGAVRTKIPEGEDSLRAKSSGAAHIANAMNGKAFDLGIPAGLLFSAKRDSPRAYVRQFLLGFLPVMLAAACAWPFVPNDYEARATVVLRPVETSAPSDRGHYLSANLDENAVQSEIDRLSSPALAAVVIRKHDLARDPEFAPSRGWLRSLFGSAAGEGATRPDENSGMNALTERLLSKLSVSRERKSYTVRFGYRSKDPQMAAAMTATLLDAYIDQQIRIKRDQMERRTHWLTERLELLRERHDVSDRRVRSFMLDNSLIDNGENLSLERQISTLSVELAQARIRAIDTTARAGALQEMQKAGTLESASDVLASPSVQRLKEMLTIALTKPAVLIGEVKAIEERTVSESDRIVQAVKIEALAAHQREAELRRGVSALQTMITDRRKLEFQLEDLRRDETSDKAVLELTLAQLKSQAGLDGSFGPDTDVLARPEVPLRSSSRTALVALIGSLLLALLAGCAMIWQPIAAAGRSLVARDPGQPPGSQAHV